MAKSEPNIRKTKNSNGTISYKLMLRKIGHKPIHKSFPNLKDARAYRDKYKARMIRVHHDPELRIDEHTVAEAIDKYIADKDYPSGNSTALRCEWWRVHMGPIKLDQVNWTHIQDGINKLKAESCLIGTSRRPTGKKRSNSTVNRYHAAISAVLTHVKKNGRWIMTNPAKDVPLLKESNTQTRYLRAYEVDALRTTCNHQQWDRLWFLVAMALNTGARKSELLSIRWRQVRIKADVAKIDIVKRKNGRPLTLTIAGEALDLLRHFHNVDMGGVTSIDSMDRFIFPSTKFPERQYKSLEEHWQQARKDAGLWHPEDPEKHCKFHTLRHTCASWLLQGGNMLPTVAQVLGHTSLKATERYAHLQADQGSKAIIELFGGKL